jgi:hypothetical protein
MCKCPGAFAGAPPKCESALSTALPPTSIAQQKVSSICTATKKDHVSCDKCTDAAPTVSSPCRDDPLDVLSDLCTAYPTSSDCTHWSHWCGNNSASALVTTYCKRPQNQSLLRSSISTKSPAPPRARASAGAGAALLLAALLLPALSR